MIRQDKVVAIRNMKTGSNTIDFFLSRNRVRMWTNAPCMNNFLGRHTPFKAMEVPLVARYGSIDDFIFITAVREPIARAESWCAYFMPPQAEPNEYLRDTFLMVPNDEMFLNGGDVPNLHVFKTETLDADMKAFGEKMGWDVLEVERRNTRKERDDRQPARKVEINLTEETKDLIRERFAWTIDNYYS